MHPDRPLKRDAVCLETLAVPGEIVSMVVGRFFDQNIESIILAKVLNIHYLLK